ncbi:hypothetical protein [Alicyclobacillus acidiphilus]|uniref:hypothetical protein n=1 Tax=Alicyclobacillus acidiphilus TaxID=182455 RepID=UPI0008296366|nr:hypothetical protein [Alicyclobacillus acidiphilus]
MLFSGVPSNLLEASNLQHVIYPDAGGQAAIVSVPAAPQTSSKNTSSQSESDSQQQHTHSSDPGKGRYIDLYG